MCKYGRDPHVMCHESSDSVYPVVKV